MKFPTHSQEILRFLREIRFSLDSKSDEISVDKFFALCHLIEELHNFEYEIFDNHIIIDQDNLEISFPLPLPRIKLIHIACGYAEWLLNKYTLEGFVQVEFGDTIIDCGAFVGGFSIACAKTAGLIVAIEPSSHNYSCLDRNLKHFDNALAVRFALGDNSSILKLNCSTSAVEHSLIDPDDGIIEYQEVVAVSRLDDLVKAIGVEKIDFLKVEAEGFEPEVIKGLGCLLPEKIAIDVSPERGGKSPAAEISKDLQAKGYECKQRGNVLFARRSA
ncbi:MAG: FkbM family methyltransferase [Methylococcaceae bacterium]|nr:FkbM family methyltransferase [Methylococcaceae bacterium]